MQSEQSSGHLSESRFLNSFRQHSSPLPAPPGFAGLRVTVMGLGNFGGGVAAATYLAAQGARVTVTDRRDASQLERSLSELQHCRIEQYFMGGHPDEAFEDIDLLVVNPGVKPNDEIVNRCRANGTMVTSEIELFLAANPARVIAVTGTNGKSTTTALIAHLLQPWASETRNRVWLGGNIGVSLLSKVSLIAKDDIVVLEISSFQLEYLRGASFAPDVAVITNFAPNHLDWHGNIEHYKAAKQLMLNHQVTGQAAIVPHSDGDVVEWRVRSRRFCFGIDDPGENGCFYSDETLILRDHSGEDAIRLRQPAHIPGAHNSLNIAAAACACWLMNVAPDSFQSQLRSFKMLPHRLQLVGEGKGLRFINDSVATTPESTIAALESFSNPIVLIAGGADKGADLSEMAAAIQRKAHAAVLIGDTANVLKRHLGASTETVRPENCVVAEDFSNAFLSAVALAPEGAIVLLSPGCASFGWFRDYRDRGEQFTQLALDWIQA